MNATARSICFCGLVSLLLTACGSSPPARYFSLSPTVSISGQDSEDAAELGLGPIRMPDYLDRSQLVTRGSGAELNVDEFNRWAEPLTPAFHRIVSTDVDNAVDGLVVVTFPWESAVNADVDYRLLGEVIRFESDRSGQVVLELQWGVRVVASGEFVIRPRRTRYTSQAGSSDNPAAVVSAMNDALAEFSRDIASEMQAVLQQ